MFSAHATRVFAASLVSLLVPAVLLADPCGMVPPIYTGPVQPIKRVGLQETYVFYKDGVETFVIRPGYEGKVDEFGMLIPFPKPPALRKMPDAIFTQIANAIDPPEVVVYTQIFDTQDDAFAFNAPLQQAEPSAPVLAYNTVRVVRQEAVGMYEVAVLEAGSAAALKRWMDEHGYKYPDGMDKVCEEYVEERWCFVAVKTKVGQKDGVDPEPAQRNVNSQLPDGSTFDGHVQAMGFRFQTDELVVPMRLAAFNEGELRNIVYLLTDSPKKIRSIPEEYVVRQVSGGQLIHHLTKPLPLRIIGGGLADIPEHRRKSLPGERNPEPHNGAARDAFASDLLAVSSGKLSLDHEEAEKNLLSIGERLGLRGTEIDTLHEQHLAAQRKEAVASALGDLKEMSLTVVDGDFPREVLARKNLQFGEYKMPSRRNKAEVYDVKSKAPAAKQPGVRHVGAVDWQAVDKIAQAERNHEMNASSLGQKPVAAVIGTAGAFLLAAGLFWQFRRRAIISLAALCALLFASSASADPCGMVPPIYTGEGQAIERVGHQMTYVFYKDGVETFVIRPGFTGKVDEFGMLIPFPKPPALRKVPDNIFAHIGKAIDPPEVVINLFPPPPAPASAEFGGSDPSNFDGALQFAPVKDFVRVVKQEAVGMYEVAVLEAGSAAALNRWMDQHGYQYPKGMDDVCEDYIEDRWCFVAVKTKVGTKDGVEPKPAQRDVNSTLPDGSVFDGNVQAMGFRFETEQLVVPMRLSAFNAGDLRNIVYLVTDKPQKIRSIPEEYVVRQIDGEILHANVMGPLPLRILGGTEKDLKAHHLRGLDKRRNPEKHNGAARDLFAGDLLAVSTGELSLAHEEKEKELLAIGERLGLRGKEIDGLNENSLAEMRKETVTKAIDDVKKMSLTVVDGDFPREVLGKHNLAFAEYEMPARHNKRTTYDANNKGPGRVSGQGTLFTGELKVEPKDEPKSSGPPVPPAFEGAALPAIGAFAGFALILAGLFYRRRQ